MSGEEREMGERGENDKILTLMLTTVEAILVGYTR